ncbi:thiopeptide-type bacteriocin biosynthesis protein, partial [Rhizobium sp. SIMBA_035]
MANEITPILDKLIAEKTIKSAFFIRYTDPHYHLRLRLNLCDKKLYAEVLEKLYDLLDPYFQNEMIWNLQFDSY